MGDGCTRQLIRGVKYFRLRAAEANAVRKSITFCIKHRYEQTEEIYVCVICSKYGVKIREILREFGISVILIIVYSLYTKDLRPLTLSVV